MRGCFALSFSPFPPHPFPAPPPLAHSLQAVQELLKEPSKQSCVGQGARVARLAKLLRPPPLLFKLGRWEKPFLFLEGGVSVV